MRVLEAYDFFVLTLFIGMALVFAGVVLIVLGLLGASGSARGGAVVIVGPLPIVVASGPREAKVLMALALVLLAAAVAVFVALNLLAGGAGPSS